jgi:hypothetical protein
VLKTLALTLPGRDSAYTPVLTELPALIADRHARTALKIVGADPTEGVVGLALKHLSAIRALGHDGVALLNPFVSGVDWERLRDWRSVQLIHNAALGLHVAFLADRQPIEIPVRMQAQAIQRGSLDLAVSFCTPVIAHVLSSRYASYRELETMLSTEDAYNIVEMLNVDALHQFHNTSIRNPAK